jgi:ABC-type polar amino acid transport system ATPase subunit
MEAATMKPPPDETILEVRGLKKSYGDFEVLKGIDLTVTKADVFVIIGPSGCGKSTFLRCLNLLEPYQEGQVLLRGQPASMGRPADVVPTRDEQHQAQRLRQKVGMVFQQFNLFPHMSTVQNVMCCPMHVLKKSRDESYTIAEKMLRKVGMWDHRDHSPLELSGGQQQRVAIARALAMSPDVVLFDEATSALDPKMTHEVLKVIRDLVFVDGMTTLMVTHDMGFARDVADAVIFFHQGRINAQGTPAYIFDEKPTQVIRDFLTHS